MIIAPSILAADALNLERDIGKVVDAGCDWLHVDVMDAHFVPNLAYSPEVVRRLRSVFSVPLDVHLMMDNPEKYIPVFLDAGADILTIHAEAYDGRKEPGTLSAEDQLRELLHGIRQSGAKAGIAIRPGTGLEAVQPLLEDADLVLAMTVEPGFGGQKLRPEVADKIEALRKLGYAGEIEADGGITEENLKMLAAKGLSVAVMGTAVFRSANPRETIHRLRQSRNGKTDEE